MAKATCSIDDCESIAAARGWCSKHWQRWKKHGDPTFVVQVQGDDWTRFWSKISGADPLRCWTWTDTLDQDGYGAFRLGTKHKRAHRQSWEFLRGPIPDDPATGKPLDLDHECRNRACVNPWHLDPVTNAENKRRAHWYLEDNMCLRGHWYFPENEEFASNGSRCCKTCRRAGVYLRRWRKRGVHLAAKPVYDKYYAEVVARARRDAAVAQLDAAA